MNSLSQVPKSLKQIITSSGYSNFSRKWFNRSCLLQCRRTADCGFEQCRMIHKTAISLGVHNVNQEIAPKNNIKQFRDMCKTGPELKDFITHETLPSSYSMRATDVPYIKNISGHNQKVYFEVYGCQMNVNDTEVIWSILKSHGYQKTEKLYDADVVLLITCAIRDSAEIKVWHKLEHLSGNKKRWKNPNVKIGLLGCMAERLKDKILEREQFVDVIAGPDSYKDLPRLLSVSDHETAINVILSFDETYADVSPVRLSPDSTSAFVSIMRGCDNMCTYCIVPFTRGRERSRPIGSIVREIQNLSENGVKEVTLLGQNVNSYRDLSQSEFYTASNTETHLVKGFKTVYKNKKGGLRFSDLLDKVSLVNPEMRIRFTSAHPKDFPDEVLQLIAERPNICKELHVPAQSGNSAVLERMRRGYTREAYLELIHHARDIIPNVSLSSDFIAGFCGETEEEFQDTLSLLQLVKYDKAFLFSYSMREKTTAHRRLKDDVETHVKLERFERMTSTYRTEVTKINQSQIGQLQLVLVEGFSKRSNEYLKGRNDGNVRVIIPSIEVPSERYSERKKPMKIGDYVVVKVNKSTSLTLAGTPLYHSSISEYSSSKDNI